MVEHGNSQEGTQNNEVSADPSLEAVNNLQRQLCHLLYLQASESHKAVTIMIMLAVVTASAILDFAFQVLSLPFQLPSCKWSELYASEF